MTLACPAFASSLSLSQTCFKTNHCIIPICKSPRHHPLQRKYATLMQQQQQQQPLNKSSITEKKPTTNPTQLVNQALTLVQNTDRGSNMNLTTREQVDSLLSQLSHLGRNNLPLEQPTLWGEWFVSYVSVGSPQKRKGQPVGGGFRSGLGKFLFWTRHLRQVLSQPNTLINMVEFAILGILRGSVRLYGKFERMEVWGLANAIRVKFEKPELRLGWVKVRFGKESEVKIGTMYLDERVRIGKGSRGSWFLFTKPGVIEGAQ